MSVTEKYFNDIEERELLTEGIGERLSGMVPNKIKNAAKGFSSLLKDKEKVLRQHRIDTKELNRELEQNLKASAQKYAQFVKTRDAKGLFRQVSSDLNESKKTMKRKWYSISGLVQFTKENAVALGIAFLIYGTMIAMMLIMHNIAAAYLTGHAVYSLGYWISGPVKFLFKWIIPFILFPIMREFGTFLSIRAKVAKRYFKFALIGDAIYFSHSILADMFTGVGDLSRNYARVVLVTLGTFLVRLVSTIVQKIGAIFHIKFITFVISVLFSVGWAFTAPKALEIAESVDEDIVKNISPLSILKLIWDGLWAAIKWSWETGGITFQQLINLMKDQDPALAAELHKRLVNQFGLEPGQVSSFMNIQIFPKWENVENVLKMGSSGPASMRPDVVSGYGTLTTPVDDKGNFADYTLYSLFSSKEEAVEKVTKAREVVLDVMKDNLMEDNANVGQAAKEVLVTTKNVRVWDDVRIVGDELQNVGR